MAFPRLAAGIAALALSGLGVVGLQSPAYANHNCPNPGGNYPPGQCATDGHGDNAGGNGTKVKKGDKIRCEGSGYKPDSQGFCYAKSTPILLGTLTADSTGHISGEFAVPAGLELGNHSVILTGIDPTGAPRTTVSSFTLTAAGISGSTGGKAATGGKAVGAGTSAPGLNVGVGTVQLPRTGTEIATVSVLGLGLLGAGGVALYNGRRRRITV